MLLFSPDDDHYFPLDRFFPEIGRYLLQASSYCLLIQFGQFAAHAAGSVLTEIADKFFQGPDQSYR